MPPELGDFVNSHPSALKRSHAASAERTRVVPETCQIYRRGGDAKRPGKSAPLTDVRHRDSNMPESALDFLAVLRAGHVAVAGVIHTTRSRLRAVIVRQLNASGRLHAKAPLLLRVFWN